MFVVVVQDFIVDVQIPVCCWLHGDIMGSHVISQVSGGQKIMMEFYPPCCRLKLDLKKPDSDYVYLHLSRVLFKNNRNPPLKNWLVSARANHPPEVLNKSHITYRIPIRIPFKSHSSPMKTLVSHPMKKSPNKNPTPS